jgi:hypothetical protein
LLWCRDNDDGSAIQVIVLEILFPRLRTLIDYT